MAKHITIFVSCLILISFTNFTILNAQWESCNNGIKGSRAINSFIVNGNNTYAATDVIYMTTDYGDNWTTKNNGLESNFGTIILTLATNGNNIFAGTMYNGIFLSSDKGENWVRKSSGLPIKDYNQFDTLYSVSIYAIIISGDNTFIGTDEGVYISTNNGNNWIQKNNGLPYEINGIDTNKRLVFSLVVKGNNIFAGSRYGVYLSTDNGENWTARNKGMKKDVYALAVNGNNIYAAACFNGILLSTNDGDDWINIVRKDTCISRLLLKEKYIFAAGGFYISSDNGVNWVTRESGLQTIGVTAIIINGDYIFAGTSSSGIYRAKLSDLGITDVKETEQTNEIKIFPNPASDEFRLRFHAPTETTVQLSVFDLLGNCILSQTLQSTEGTNEKNINCEKLPQGYYYVKINMNEVVETIPMVIVM